jgi:hypothetical protein
LNRLAGLLLASCALCSLLACEGQAPTADAGWAEVGAGDAPEPVMPADALPDGVDRPSDMPAPGCGSPGQPCCPPSACGGDACCAAGMCVALGDPCTQSRVTHGTCVRSICERCGSFGQTCCSYLAGGCREGTCYSDGICEGCGGDGQRCCRSAQGQPSCAAGLTCGALVDGRCGACGAAGEPCCEAPRSTAPICDNRDLICSGGYSGRCITCGKLGQPCCFNNACEAGTACVREDNGYLCRACGMPGQSCCPGRLCSAGGCCVADQESSPLVRYCVAPGQKCPGLGSGLCDGRTCGGNCGHIGGPCCRDRFGGYYCTEPGATCPLTGAVPPQCQPCSSIHPCD